MPPTTPAWNDENLGDPHAVSDKAQRVRSMFAAISRSYDLNNRVHSLGRDQAWRRAAVRMAEVRTTDIVLDVACGTGDLAMAFADAGADRIIGSDFTFDMLAIAQQKRSRRHDLTYHCADAMRLPLADQSVNIVSIAFGIRNVADPTRAMREFYRVLKPGGRLIILEFSLPRNPVLRGLYNFYFQQVMPRTASLIARDRSGAYRYLPRSVNTFIDRKQMNSMMVDSGFVSISQKVLTCGIAVIYRGIRQ